MDRKCFVLLGYFAACVISSSSGNIIRFADSIVQEFCVTVSATSVKLATKSTKRVSYRVQNELDTSVREQSVGRERRNGWKECFTRDWIVIRDRNAIRGWFFCKANERKRKNEREKEKKHRWKNKAEEPAALSDVFGRQPRCFSFERALDVSAAGKRDGMD